MHIIFLLDRIIFLPNQLSNINWIAQPDKLIKNSYTILVFKISIYAKKYIRKIASGIYFKSDFYLFLDI